MTYQYMELKLEELEKRIEVLEQKEKSEDKDNHVIAKTHKILIDIDDNLYTRLFDNGVDNRDDAADMAKAIRKGTVFPNCKYFEYKHDEFNVLLKFEDIMKKYRKWLSEIGLKEHSESLLIFLYLEGYLNELDKEEV